VFAIAHLNVLQGAYALLLGVVLSLIYLSSGTIWAAVAMHVGFNSVSVLAQILPQALTGSILFLLYALSIACVVWFLATNRRRRERLED
jgi:membrane protease YdiL (CAAX protease family)